MEKKRPTYALDTFKAAAKKLGVTITAAKDAGALGFDRDGITDVIKSMEVGHFYKSMTSDNNSREWQDVYHVPYDGLVIYVKFVADVVTEFRLLSFKEK
jgi:motility quorum-sensing regulator / GCU-specific mRNA interferase toxin